MTVDELRSIMAHASLERCQSAARPLTDAMAHYDIDQNVKRECAFLAQLAHESGCLRYTEEIASGDAYEGRKDLGNTEPGDGRKFKGRGYIQLTGRANYQKYADATDKTLDEVIGYLQTPEGAADVSGWFWQTHGLNALADENTLEAFQKITKRINGGLNGFDQRLAYWKRAQAVLS